MLKCDNEYISPILKDNDYPGQFYCPEFDEEHELYTNYLYQDHSIWKKEFIIIKFISKKDHSYFRLMIERCNNETSSITCATREQIDEYAYMNKFGVQGRIGTSNLGAEDNDKSDL